MIILLKSFFVFISLINLFQVKDKKETNLNLLKQKAEIICKQKGSTPFSLAYSYYLNKKYDSCYIHSNKALELSTTQEEKDILNYIQGSSASKNKLYKKALQNFLEISENSFYKNLKHKKLGYVYLCLEQYKKSVFHYSIWEQDIEKASKESKRASFHNLALSHVFLKNYADSDKYFKKELAQAIIDKDTLIYINAKINIANAYYNQYRDNEAIPLFIESYNLAKQYSNIELKKSTSKNMAVVEKNRKNYKASVNYYIETSKWKDSIWNRDRIWELTEADKKVAVAQKEIEIVRQKEKLKLQTLQKKGLITGISFLVTFIGFLGYFYRQRTKQNKLITEQKEALDIANKTKDYLFSVVSHDLRSPINTLRLQHEKILRQIKKKDLSALRTTTNATIALTDSTYRLLNNVLHWSLEQSNQMVFNQDSYPLSPLIEQVVFDFENIADTKEIQLQTSLNSLLIKIDLESLKIILRNLIDNAIKYTENGGTIHIKSGVHSSEQCYIEIEDTGIGIPPETLDKINSLKDISVDKINRSKGVGLGLLLCQTLVKKNKGKLIFESQVGKGTTTKILFSLSS